MAYFSTLDGSDSFNGFGSAYNGGSSQLSSLPNYSGNSYGAPTYDPSIPPGPPAPAIQQMQEPGYAQPSSAQPSASAMALAQQPAPQPTYAGASNAPQPRQALYSGPSYWDRLAGKRGEVAKMIVLSLVVLLAISLDRMSSHYLTGYIGAAFLTMSQEFLVRLSYPLIVLLCLWMLKAV